ncbi:unnamed protein product [Paramecium octaurelia]|uniref:Uncharacterized protein n=1 Tax=Paramecium octaurelia TaxID=43137 RepID=A0A8S1SZ90_PAROT|nr:unnamed protein product [Paramecium octaurelia]
MQFELEKILTSFKQLACSYCNQKNQSTAYIQDGMTDEDDESFFLRINKNSFYYVYRAIEPKRNLAYFQMRLTKRKKYILANIEIFRKDLYDNTQIKAFIDDNGYLNFSFHYFLNENCSIKVPQLLDKKKIVITDAINKFEMKIHNNMSGLNNAVNQNIPSNKQLIEPLPSVQSFGVKLIKVVNIVKSNPEQKRIYYQVQGSNNLCEDIYINIKEIDQKSYSLIQNGKLLKLEKQINTLLSFLDIDIQGTFRNLFLTIYLENEKRKYFEFNQLMPLSEFFERKLQFNETFQIRIQLLIQVLCVSLLKIFLNLDLGSTQQDIILINSRKQIKLDMLAYLKCSSCKTEQQSEQSDQMEEILNYFEFLLPYRERPILIQNHNITNELQNMKQLIKQKKITVKLITQQLIHIDKQIQQYVGL